VTDRLTDVHAKASSIAIVGISCVVFALKQSHVREEHIPARRRCDLDMNPMTLKLEGDLDILKMYHRTENEVVIG